MKMHFNELFVIQNGMISPRFNININGVIMSPGVSFGKGVSMGGVDLSHYSGSYFNVEIQNGIYIILCVYN